MVVFEDGLPRKSEYRRFVLRGEGSRPGLGPDDLSAMHEVLTRRFRRYLEESRAPLPEDPTERAKFAYRPNLVVVDGGAPQVASAADALTELGITDIAVCGLAKRLEEVWVPGEEFPLVLPRSSEGLYLLQRVRDEAHRFAITHHRQRRSKSMTTSVLDDVPGLGPARRTALLKHFGSVKKLRAAQPEEVAQVPGIGPALAAVVVEALAGAPSGPVIDTSTGEIIE
jgi:excinuclease ABC subunit C